MKIAKVKLYINGLGKFTTRFDLEECYSSTFCHLVNRTIEFLNKKIDEEIKVD